MTFSQLKKYVKQSSVKPSLPEFVREYCKIEFNSKYVDRVYNDMIDVMTGNRAGNDFEKAASEFIIESYNKLTK